MNIAVYVVAVLVVVTGVYFSQKEKAVGNVITTYEEVLSESDKKSVAIVEEKEIDTTSPTKKPSPTNFPIPTLSPQSSDLSEYKYPNSQIVSSSSNSLFLESSDNSDSITDWYKQMLNSQGMNVKTFVMTKVNDQVLNKLVGADGNKEISVEISKESMSSSVKIFVTITEK